MHSSSHPLELTEPHTLAPPDRHSSFHGMFGDPDRCVQETGHRSAHCRWKGQLIPDLTLSNGHLEVLGSSSSVESFFFSLDRQRLFPNIPLLRSLELSNTIAAFTRRSPTTLHLTRDHPQRSSSLILIENCLSR